LGACSSRRDFPNTSAPDDLRRRLPARAAFPGAILLALCSVAPAPAAGPAYDPAEVLARVGGHAITAREVVDEVARARGSASAGSAAESVTRALDSLVREAALAQVARAEKIDARPDVRRDIDRLLGSRLRAERLEPQIAAVAVGDADVEAWYRAHAEELRQPRRIRGAVVRVASSAKEPAERRAKRRALAEAALEGATALPAGTPAFGAVAARLSDDAATRYRGGETGWLVEGAIEERWPRPVVEALFALDAPGKLGPVVEDPSGFWLVRLVEQRPAAPRPLAEVRDAIRQRLLAERVKAAEEAFFAGIERSAGVVRGVSPLDGVLAEIANRTASGAPAPLAPSGN